MHIKLGTRGSKLALAQTNWVKERLEQEFPQHTYEVVIIKTKGDRSALSTGQYKTQGQKSVLKGDGLL